MYTIGQISKLVQLSVDALRYYDEINLLNPAYINEDTGYRYYNENQVKDLFTIIELKSCHFSLDAIKELIHSNDTEHLKAAYQSKVIQLQDKIKKTKYAMHLLNQKIFSDRPSKQVMIVDDSDFMRFMQRDILTKYNYLVIAEANDGISAQNIYKTENVDLVIMNLDMPNSNGFEGLSGIYSNNIDANIIMCSANCTLNNCLESFSLGAKHFIAKPFNMEEFIGLIDAFFISPSTFDLNQVKRIQKLSTPEQLNKYLSQSQINDLHQICLHPVDSQISDQEILYNIETFYDMLN